MPPERCREILGMVCPVFSIINMIYYDEKTPVTDILEEALLSSEYLLTMDEDDELDDSQTTLYDFWIPQALENIIGGGSSGNSTEWANVFLNTARFIKDQSIKMVEGIQAGDPVAIATGAVGTTVGVFLLSVLTRGIGYDLIEESYQRYKDYENSTHRDSG